jgi:hypothetical protein
LLSSNYLFFLSILHSSASLNCYPNSMSLSKDQHHDAGLAGAARVGVAACSSPRSSRACKVILNKQRKLVKPYIHAHFCMGAPCWTSWRRTCSCRTGTWRETSRMPLHRFGNTSSSARLHRGQGTHTTPGRSHSGPGSSATALCERRSGPWTRTRRRKNPCMDEIHGFNSIIHTCVYPSCAVVVGGC